MIFNLKRILNKLPGGENKLKNIIAAYWLVKECYEKRTSTAFLEEKYESLLDTISKNNITLVEEEILVNKFFEDIANVTGAAVSTNEPVIKPRKVKKDGVEVIKRGKTIQ